MRAKSDLRPPTPGTKPLPRMQSLGRVDGIPINYVKVYAPKQGVILKAHHENDDGCRLFLDLEDSGRNEGIELHLGVGGNLRPEPLRNSNVKPHIDVYVPRSEVIPLVTALYAAVPPSEIPKLIQALAHVNRRDYL